MEIEKLEKIATFIRYCILKATNKAGSGNPTSSLSATELMTGLVFGGSFHYDADEPGHPNNDRLIFSKGHASPLLYSLWVAAGRLTEEELLTYRSFGSPLEGHPAVAFPYTEAATGSLGQGLSIGLGMAINAKYVDELPYRTYVLLGDSEMAEGSQWEAIQLAAHYKLHNLVGVLDVNRLGQRGETMYGHDLDAYARRVSAFGWTAVKIDGHSLREIVAAYEKAAAAAEKPVMIIAKTIKGKGVLSVEDINGWHGKPLGEEALEEASKHWGPLDKSVRGTIPKPQDLRPGGRRPRDAGRIAYVPGRAASTREAFGNALKRIYPKYPQIVSLDAEVSNSTYACTFKDEYPDRFFEMFIAEQNMVGAAVGLARRGKIPYVSTFAAFFTRAFDQIRMSQYSDANIKFVGSHGGVSIGMDGPSQMGLEDLAMFRAILGSVVLYPSDAVATEKLVEEAAAHDGLVYIRTTRSKTPVIYSPDEEFHIGGAKTVASSDSDAFTVVSAGYTLHEAIAAHSELAKLHIPIRVIDLYSIKPLDREVLELAAAETGGILVVEDHCAEGGIGEAVFSALRGAAIPIHHAAVVRRPLSCSPAEQLGYQGISSKGIADRIKELVRA
jgi:transketolase